MARTKVTLKTLSDMRDELIGRLRVQLAQDTDVVRVYQVERKLQTYQRLRIDLLAYVEHMEKENK